MAVTTKEARTGTETSSAATTSSTIAKSVTEAREWLIPSPAATTPTAKMPVANVTLLFKAEVWNVRHRAFEVVRVLADSASEAQLCTEDYYAEAVPARVNIQGINSSAVRTTIGCSFIRIHDGQQARIFRLPMTTTASISGGRSHVLLHAETCQQLGLLRFPVNPSTAELTQLPQLPLSTSTEWLHMHELVGTTVLDNSATPDGMFDLFEASAAVAAVTEANVEKVLRDCNDQPFPVLAYSLDDIRWGSCASQKEIDASGLIGVSTGGAFTLKQVRQLKELCVKYRDVFATGKIPHANGRDPVRVDLIPDPPDARYKSRPHHCPTPGGPQHHRRYLNRLRQFWLDGGMLYRNPYCQWATRVGVVGKGHEDDMQMYASLRATGDDRPINKRAQPYNYEMPDGPAAIERASRPCRYSFSTDANAAFNAFRIHEDSQKYFTVWLPDGDLPNSGASKYSMLRLGFGFRNSPAIMVEWYDQMLGDLLPETREWLAKYFDDFKLNSPLTANADNDFAVFILCLEDLFLGCRRYDVELGPPKSSGGFHKTVFYGVEIYNSGGSGLARSRIDAIRALKYPENVSEMRQVLGLLTQCRKWVNMYSTSSNSLSHLLKNGVEWQFGDEQKRDFDALRAALIDSTLNYAPDYAHELILSTDASDYAIGSRLFQQIDDVEYNIGFWSRTLSLSEQKMAVYFRELLGILEGIRRARIYALSSPLPLRVQTDQRSLIFVDSLSKGPISHHHLAAVADVNYKIEYIKGETNVYADALSRYGCSAPRALSSNGMLAAVETLLDTIGDSHRDDMRVWVAAGTNSVEVARQVQEWRRTKNKITTGVVDATMLTASWTFAVVVPGALKAPATCASLLDSGKHFACLVPLDLLSVVSTRHDGKFDQQTFAALQRTAKIALPAANFCWVVAGDNFADVVSMAANCSPMSSSMRTEPADALHDVTKLKVADLRAKLTALHESAAGTKAVLAARLKASMDAIRVGPAAAPVRQQQQEPDDDDDDVFMTEVEQPAAEPLPTRHRTLEFLAAMQPISSWPPEQRDEDCPAANRVTRPDGMMLFDPGNAATCVVVPSQRRQQLLQLVHTALGHNVHGMYKELRRAFYWKTMRADAKDYAARCNECKLNKNRIRHQHGLWRHRALDSPREHYAMDIKKMSGTSGAVYCLAVVDRMSGWLCLARLVDKTTSSVIAALLSHVVWRFGFFTNLTIDSEKSFQSAAFKKWAAGLGIEVAQPLGYSPTGNASAEVIWKHVEQACKPPHDFPPDQCRLHEIAFEWNTQTKTATGMTPFMVQFGLPPVTASAQLSRSSTAGATAVPLPHDEGSSVRTASDVAAVVGVAVRRANYERRTRAADRNLASRGSLKPLEVGSKAFVYQPPSGAVVNSRGEGRNRAFVPSFTGPATITTRLSATGYVLVDDETGTRYNRHRRHLRPV